MKLVHQGTVLGEDNQKMAKSAGNVVNPDAMIDQHGADAMRLYEMFMGPLEAMKPWSTQGVEGVARFLDRVWRLVVDEDGRTGSTRATRRSRLRACCIRPSRRSPEDIEGLRFNTAIAQMMIFTNEATKWERRPRAVIEPFVLLLSPFAPHLAEELWERLGHHGTLAYEPWPAFDPELLRGDTVTVAVQVNGKLRATLELPRASTRPPRNRRRSATSG